MYEAFEVFACIGSVTQPTIDALKLMVLLEAAGKRSRSSGDLTGSALRQDVRPRPFHRMHRHERF
jgi:hypothetical protein